MDQVTQPAVAFARWREAGVFAALVPALANVSDVALHAIDALPRPGMRTRPQRRALRLAALFSDCSGAQTEAALRALRFSNADIAWIGALIDRWQRAGAALTDALQTDLEISDESMRRLAAAVGRLRVSAFVRLAAARWCGASRLGTPAPTARRVRALYRQLGHIAMHNPIDVADLAIDGDDLRQLGIRPGPVYGRLLASLLDDVLVQPAHNTREWLLARVPHIVAAGVGKST